MLIEQTHYPIFDDGNNYLLIALVILLLAGTTYLIMEAIQSPDNIINNKI